MRPKRCAQAISVFLLISGPALADGPDCRAISDSFIVSPNEEGRLLLEQGQCWHQFEYGSTYFAKLKQRVQGGDTSAAILVAEHLHATDGAELEDWLVALGQFSDRKPEVFLDFAKTGRVTTRTLTNAVKILPLDTSDDLPRQLTLLRARATKLRAVSRQDLAEQRHIALKALNEAIVAVEQHAN
jgi:hypothetical protein